MPVSPNNIELYQSIARKVKEGTCVLFLGAGALVVKDAHGQYLPITDLCARHLMNKYGLTLGADESATLSYVCSLLRVKNLSTDNLLQDDVAEFYSGIAKSCELHPMLEQLSDLHFRMIITTTPDNFLTHLYDQIALPYFSDAYNYSKPSAGFSFDFEKDKRVLIFNLLGIYTKPESLVLTYKQQLNYIRKIVSEQQNERLPDALINAFKDFRHHLFLGFDFDEWALRLLLDTLYKNVRDNVQPYAYLSKTDKPAQAETRVFFQGEFGMQFPMEDMETFVTGLQEQYNSLSSTDHAATSEAPKVKVLFLHNELADKDGFEQLSKHMRSLPVQIVTLSDATGKGDVQAWLKDMLDECPVVLPLLSADFYDPDQNPAFEILPEIVQRNNPRKGTLVMPVLLKVVDLDGPLGQMATLRPADRTAIMGSGMEDRYSAEIVETLKKYISNLGR